MLVLSLLSLLIAIPLFSSNISPIQLSRVTSVSFIFAALLTYNIYDIEMLNSGVSLYSGLFHVSTISAGVEIFILLVGGVILLPWASDVVLSSSTFSNIKGDLNKDIENTQFVSPIIGEYSMIIVFTTIGALFLISSTDLVSIYLAIELQSFAVYILSSLYRNSESATAAGLKYFLLGALSSALILLGSSIIYGYTGLTNLDSLSTLISASSHGLGDDYTAPIILGLVVMAVGFLFKIASAPFHNWAPDVYDGVPTIVTTWISIMPKISIFVLLITINSVTDSLVLSIGDITINVWQGLLLVCSLLSLITGTVVGLAQYRIKRLLAYSTISHVGFMLLALSISGEESIDALLFYLIQYSLTSVNMFFILLAFGYSLSKYVSSNTTIKQYVFKDSKDKTDVSYIQELNGQFHEKPLLALSMAVSLFSMAGIPPLMGFFGKYAVLYTAIHNGYYFLSLIGILTSVISAAYYIRIVRVLYFDAPSQISDNLISNVDGSLDSNTKFVTITSLHSYVIAVLTLVIMLFVLQPSLILNSTQLMAMTLYNY